MKISRVITILGLLIFVLVAAPLVAAPNGPSETISSGKNVYIQSSPDGVGGNLGVQGDLTTQGGVVVSGDLTPLIAAGASLGSDTLPFSGLYIETGGGKWGVLVSSDDLIFNNRDGFTSALRLSESNTVNNAIHVTDSSDVDINTNLTVDGFIASESSSLTIASGVVTAIKSRHTVDTEASGATDDLDTITASTAGRVVILSAVDDARSVVFKDATGNLQLSGDFTADNSQDIIVLISDGVNWLEVSRSDNGA